jgi:hypothetical protein
VEEEGGHKILAHRLLVVLGVVVLEVLEQQPLRVFLELL